MSRQGRCYRCNVVHRWPESRVKLAAVRCPDCGGGVERTSDLWEGRVLHHPRAPQAGDVVRTMERVEVEP